MMTEAEELLALNLSERTLMRCLPPILGDIARIGGVESMVKIAEAYGGANVYFPASVTDDSAIALLVGKDIAQALANHFANGFGVKVEIPNSLFGRTLKRLKTLKLLEEGLSLSQVCKQVRVSRKTAYLWRRNYLGEVSP